MIKFYCNRNKWTNKWCLLAEFPAKPHMKNNITCINFDENNFTSDQKIEDLRVVVTDKQIVDALLFPSIKSVKWHGKNMTSS